MKAREQRFPRTKTKTLTLESAEELTLSNAETTESREADEPART